MFHVERLLIMHINNCKVNHVNVQKNELLLHFPMRHLTNPIKDMDHRKKDNCAECIARTNVVLFAL